MKNQEAPAHAAKLHYFSQSQNQGILSSRGFLFLKLGVLYRALMALAAIVISPSAWAVDYTWAGTSNAWTTNASWTPLSGPQLSSSSGNTDVAIFSNLGNSTYRTPNITSNRTVNSLQFAASAIDYTFSGGPGVRLEVMGNGNSTVTSTIGIINNSTATQTFSLGVQNTNGNGLVSSITGGALVFNGGVNLSSSGTNRTVVFGGAGNITVASTIANGGSSTAGAVTVTSTGNTLFSGNNTYGGLTTMNAAGGILTLSGNNSGAGGGVTLTAGTLNINHANALGSGAFTISANSTFNNTSGAAVTNAGNRAWTWTDGLTFGTAASTSNNNLNLGTGVVTASTNRLITLAGNGTTLTIGRLDNTNTGSGRTLTVNGTGNILTIGGMNLSNNSTAAQVLKLAGSANINVAGAITNGTAFDHGLTTQGTGIVTLSGNNTYTGLTTISSGSTIKLDHANALGGTNNGTTVSSGGVLDLFGQTIGNEAISLSGTGISSLGGLVNTSGSNASLSGSVSLAASSSIGAGNITLSGNITESGSARVLTKMGNGTLVLSGSSNHTGGTIISDGTLAITSGNSFNGLFSLAGANGPVLKLTNVNALGNATVVSGSSASANTGTIDLATAGNYTLGAYGNSSNLGANLKFTASSGNATTLNFINNSIVSSASSGGRSITNSDNNLSIVFGGTIDISSSSASNGLTFSGSGNTTVNGAIFNSSGQSRTLDKSGAGTLTLNGDNNYQGNTSFGGSGTVLLNGNNTASNGAVSVSSSATLGGSGIVGGNVTLSGTSKIGSASSTLTLARNLTIAGINELAATSNISVSGDTTISSDYSFAVNGILGGAIAVSSNATLGGSGSISGGVNVTGSLAPGNSIESLGMGSLTFLSGSTYKYELNSTNLSGDLAFSSAGLSIADGLVALSLSELAAGTLVNDNKLTLISYRDSWNNGRFTFSSNSTSINDDSIITVGANQWMFNYNDTVGGTNYSADQSGANYFVTMTVVPEPSALILSGLGLLLLVRRRR